MRSYASVTVLCALVVCNTATPIFEPIFLSLSNDFQPDSKIFKRDVIPEKSDGTVKQVSLQSIIGGLEHSLVQSALSVSDLMHSNDAIIPEVTPPTAEEINAQRKRHSEQAKTTETPPEAKEIILQTTEIIPVKAGQPAHLLIDRVVVQEQIGDLPFIPPFEVKHTKLITAKITSGNATEISITKTSTTSTSTVVSSSTENPVISSITAGSATEHSVFTGTSTASTSSVIGSSTESPETRSTTAASTTEHAALASTGTSTIEFKANSESSSSTVPNVGTTDSDLSKTNINSSSSATTTESTTTSTTSSTTKTPIVKLKEAEQELKEKVAEIEADPVILSSRI